MKLVLMGTGPFAVPTFRALAAGPHTVVQVVCRPPRGRRGEPPAPVRAMAEELGLPLWMPESANLPESQARLKQLGADLLVVCDYGEILKDATLGATRLGGVNLHGSLLPRHRGAAPVQWAVLNGDATTGATVIQMTPGLDAGPILGSVETVIKPEETAGELEERLSLLGARLMPGVLEGIETGMSDSEPQDKSQISKAPRLQKSDGQIDWPSPAQEIKNRVRALQPWPRTFTFYKDKKGQPQRLNVDRVALVEDQVEGRGSPGEVLSVDGRLVVATGDGALEILDLQPAGKRRMTAEEWLRGAPLAVGDLLAQDSQ